MTVEHSYTALRAYERCVAGLMADPEVTGDLLLVGLWMARAIHLHQPEPSTERGWLLDDIATAIYPMCTTTPTYVDGEWTREQVTGPDVERVWELLKGDARRYDPWADVPCPRWARTPCASPMVRRRSCGKASYRWGFFTDAATGRKRMVGVCRKHEDWFESEWRANRAAVAAADVPRPPANAGGRLVPHLPDIDWPHLWRALAPEWVAPPEVETWAKPTLRVIVSPPIIPQDSPELPHGGGRRFTLIAGRN